MEITDSVVNIGEKIKKLRESKKLTQEALARKAEIASSSVYKLERGKHTPSIKTLSKIASALDTSINELMKSEAEINK